MTASLCLRFIDKRFLAQFWRIFKMNLKNFMEPKFQFLFCSQKLNFQTEPSPKALKTISTSYKCLKNTPKTSHSLSRELSFRNTKQRTKRGLVEARTRKQKYRDRMTISQYNLPQLSTSCFVLKIHLFNVSALELFPLSRLIC